MPTYLLTHLFPANFQGSPETAAAAAAWFASLGRTTPGLGNTEIPEPHRLGNCATASGRRMAYTLISAADLEAAMGFAKAWPLLARGGGIELREVPILTPSALDKTSA